MRLGYDFFQRDVLTVAPALLGAYLVRVYNNQKLVCKIVETEAYRGPEDKGCHAYRNKRTKRTEALFLPGGHAYIYMIYGMYYMLNIVTAQQDQPQAVLIRAAEPREGIETMRNLSGHPGNFERLLSGPGKLCRALAIDRTFNGYNLVEGTELFIELGETVPENQIVHSKRINIDYAEEYKDKLWRYYLSDNPCVSRIDNK